MCLDFRSVLFRSVTIESLYKIFDPEEKDSITTIDFMEGCERLGLKLENDEHYFTFIRFDRNNDQMLYYGDFCMMIIPHKQEYAKILFDKRGKITELGEERCELLKKRMRKYYENERENKEWKKRVTSEDIRQAFEQCDKEGKGYFHINDVIH